MNKLKAKRPGKRTREASDRTKGRIILAANKVFTRDGYFATNIRDIARSAGGINHALIRHYFGSKKGLWKAVMDYCYERYLENLRAVNNLEDKLGPVEYFKAQIKAYILFSIRNPSLLASLIFNDNGKSPDYEYARSKQAEVHAITKPLFAKVQDCGYFNWIDHDSFFLYLISLVEAPILGSNFSTNLNKTDIFSEEGTRRHTENVLNLLFGKDERIP